MLLSFLLFAFSFYMALIVAKKRRLQQKLASHRHLIDSLESELTSLEALSSTTFVQKEQIAYLRNRVAFAKKQAPHKM